MSRVQTDYLSILLRVATPQLFEPVNLFLGEAIFARRVDRMRQLLVAWVLPVKFTERAEVVRNSN